MERHGGTTPKPNNYNRLSHWCHFTAGLQASAPASSLQHIVLLFSPYRALGFGLSFPIPKRALRAHGLPPWGSSAPAHLTHPTAMQPAGGAHASSSSVDGLVPSVAEWGRGRGEGSPPVRGHRRGSRSPGSVS